MNEEFVDVVVIGSGFGGAVTACRAAEAGLKVLVLERGRQYRPGQFARSPLEMSTNVWDPSEGLFGLFQLWSFRHLDAVVASGVGGGSLIYANVMLRMPQRWFEAAQQRWPLNYHDLEEHYGTVEKMMGANALPAHLRPRVPKAAIFSDAATRAHLIPRPAALAVTFAAERREPGEVFDGLAANIHQFRRRTCSLCGQCDIGCNEGAKNTLDFTYLSQADHTGNADIRPLREVKRITAVGEGRQESYEVHYVEHHPPDPPAPPVPRPPGSRPQYHVVRARTVVVAAGAFGSTRLLLANRAGLPRLSGRLGTRFSGNGDALGFLTGGSGLVQADRGPVITEYAESEDGQYVVQDGGYPAVLAWLGEAFQPALYGRALRLTAARWWERKRGRADSNVGANLNRLLGSVVSRSTAPLLGMGLDPATGTMRLRGTKLDLDWSADRSGDYFDRVGHTMAAIAAASGSTFRKGPSDLVSRNISAHPLGGCPMGADAAHGVVDGHGRAFGHDGLFVVDGSVLPGPVGANPSLTIAALAERFATAIVKRGQR